MKEPSRIQGKIRGTETRRSRFLAVQHPSKNARFPHSSTLISERSGTTRILVETRSCSSAAERSREDHGIPDRRETCLSTLTASFTNPRAPFKKPRYEHSVPHRGGPRYPCVPEAEAPGRSATIVSGTPDPRNHYFPHLSPAAHLNELSRKGGEIQRGEGRAAPADRRERASGILDISIANRG
jgi:hypothetical protein